MELKKIAIPVGRAGSMPGTTGFTMACFEAEKVKVGDSLYTEKQLLDERYISSELLEALQRLLKADRDEHLTPQGVRNLARAAIAKATGEQK